MKYSVAAIDVTPNYPVFQDGFGSRTARSTGKHNELYIKALCMEQGGEKILLFACDTCIIRSVHVRAVKQELQRLYGLKPENILINYTHTHSGPALYEWLRHGVDADYVDFFFEKLMEAASRVIDCRDDGTLCYGQGETYIGVNRRPMNDEHQVSLAPNVDGETDRAVCVITIRGDDRRPKVIVSSAACHPVTVSDDSLSSDYPGVACAELEKRYPGAVAMFLQGCCGDVNPIAMNGFKSAVMLGKVYANDVRSVVESMSKPFDPLFSGAVSVLRLPIGAFEADQFRGMIASGDDHFRRYGSKLLQSIEEGVAPHEVDFSVSRITLAQDLKIIALEGEAVSAYANWIRINRPDDRLLVLGYSNGYCGYIPTRRILSEGGYEATVSYEWVGLPGKYADGVEDMVKESMLALCDRGIVE